MKESKDNETLARENAALERELVRALEKINKLQVAAEEFERYKVMYPVNRSNEEPIPSVAKTEWAYVDRIIRDMRHYQTLLEQANDTIHRYEARFATIASRYPQAVKIDHASGI